PGSSGVAAQALACGRILRRVGAVAILKALAPRQQGPRALSSLTVSDGPWLVWAAHLPPPSPRPPPFSRQRSGLEPAGALSSSAPTNCRPPVRGLAAFRSIPKPL